MPLPSCQGGHDWSDSYTERLKGASGVTILRKVRQCLGCKRTVEVPESYEIERVQSYPVAEDAQEAL